MAVSVFVGVSVDGFIARRDGALDWLPQGGEDHGFEEFLQGVDAIVMGRWTLDTVRGFGAWPYGTKPVIALSRQALDRKGLPPSVEHMMGSPAQIMARLAARGWRNLYVDGGLTIQAFLQAGLVDRLVVTRVPVLIGEGIPLFGPLPRDLPLKHVSTRTFPSGLVQSEYEVRPFADRRPIAEPVVELLSPPPSYTTP